MNSFNISISKRGFFRWNSINWWWCRAKYCFSSWHFFLSLLIYQIQGEFLGDAFSSLYKQNSRL